MKDEIMRNKILTLKKRKKEKKKEMIYVCDRERKNLIEKNFLLKEKKERMRN